MSTNADASPPVDSETRVMRYIEMNDDVPTGRDAQLVVERFAPLQYAHLLDRKLADKASLPLIAESGRVISSTLPDMPVGDVVSMGTTIESHLSIRTLALVRGGWLPSGLALRDRTIVLVDRCTVSELEQRFCNGDKTRESDLDFLDLFACRNVRINPLPFAMEGNMRECPTPDVVASQWQEASRKIKAALPMVEVVPDSVQAIQGIDGHLEETRDAMSRKEQFLIRIAPELQAPVSASRRLELWEKALLLAKEYGLPKHTLVVLAVLSTICTPNGRSPAKRLLKPSPNYGPREAYNALADLRALELLMYLFAVHPDEDVIFCTGDKNLALFWAGLRARAFEVSGASMTHIFSPVDALLPGIEGELRDSYLSAR